MKHIKDITIGIMGISLMGILALIIVDEFMMANQHGGELDASVIELLQMAITGIVGIVAGWVSSRNGKCDCDK
jgi:hypothetical protein|tara:strand:- start:197 stop:415 length:219 start_codon:yes stop_codon:yes gene_type:complete